ncbi:MAG: hypothetical protein C0514_02285 [Candidatus Puniceispirillum sp.]|nr:hypothetical protein [Candidatus Puniceispirillum sp.]
MDFNPALCPPSPFHATAIYMDGCGILLLGPPGSGKSDLALRLIMERGARLVADDLCEILHKPDGLWVQCLKEGERLLEVRGLGIAAMGEGQWIKCAPLAFALHLTRDKDIPREPVRQTLQGTHLPLYACDPFCASAAAKISLLVRHHKEEVRLLWPDTPLPHAA